MSDQTLVLILIFVFAVIALIALGASSFIRLVGLILSNGSKLEALERALLQAQTRSSQDQESNTSLPPQDDSRITQEKAD